MLYIFLYIFFYPCEKRIVTDAEVDFGKSINYVSAMGQRVCVLSRSLTFLKLIFYLDSIMVKMAYLGAIEDREHEGWVVLWRTTRIRDGLCPKFNPPRPACVTYFNVLMSKVLVLRDERTSEEGMQKMKWCCMSRTYMTIERSTRVALSNVFNWTGMD